MDLAIPTSDLGDQAQRLLDGAKHLALDKVAPASVDLAREVADRVPTHLDDVPAIEREVAKRARKGARRIERKLEERLGVQTPSTRRQHRTRRRIAVFLALIGIGGAAAYVIWRSRRGESTPAAQPPERRDRDAASPGAPASDGDYSQELRPASSRR